MVNSGNSNAFTGKAGEAFVDATVKAAAELAECAPAEVFVASTGVIGQPIPADAIASNLPGLAGSFDETAWAPAAKAIMTTDTFPKGAPGRLRSAASR